MKLFGKSKTNQDAAAATPRISAAPGQSQEEQDQSRNRMEAEMAAARANREAQKTAPSKDATSQ